jgi:hypothetical protein
MEARRTFCTDACMGVSSTGKILASAEPVER